MRCTSLGACAALRRRRTGESEAEQASRGERGPVICASYGRCCTSHSAPAQTGRGHCAGPAQVNLSKRRRLRVLQKVLHLTFGSCADRAGALRRACASETQRGAPHWAHARRCDGAGQARVKLSKRPAASGDPSSARLTEGAGPHLRLRRTPGGGTARGRRG